MEPIEDLIPSEESQDVVEAFLFQNGFGRASEYDSCGWSPLCYAAMKGDAVLVEALLASAGNPNDKTRGARPEINLDTGTPVLSICAKFKNHQALELLLRYRACVNTKAVHTPLGLACLADDAIGVRLLCNAKADPHMRNPFGDHALNMATANGSCEAMDALLLQSSDFDLSTSLHCAVLLQGGSSQAVTRLLEANAKVDEPYRIRSSLLRFVNRIKGFQYQCGKKTMFRTVGYHSAGATPLMLAIICANFEAAAVLLLEGASLEARNDRGKTAFDLIGDISVPDYLLEAMHYGDMRKCTSIISNSIMSSQGSRNHKRQDSVSSSSTLEI